MDRTGPGTLLAGRYRLAEQVSAGTVTALWRAEDLTLERPVAVRVLSATHARVQATLDAARRAALVDDVRLQRVLGVGVEAGSGYVVLEWVTGQDAASLAGKVAEPEALRIVGEAAAALRTAASRQLHHGRLGPRQVVRASDGRVRVVGTGIDVAASGQATPAAAARPESRDVRDLAAVLYALLTGLWPFGVTEGLLAAPTEKGRPVGPRALRSDVSERLDALVSGVLAGNGPESLDGLVQALEALRADGGPPDARSAGPAADAGDTETLTPVRPWPAQAAGGASALGAAGAGTAVGAAAVLGAGAAARAGAAGAGGASTAAGAAGARATGASTAAGAAGAGTAGASPAAGAAAAGAGAPAGAGLATGQVAGTAAAAAAGVAAATAQGLAGAGTGRAAAAAPAPTGTGPTGPGAPASSGTGSTADVRATDPAPVMDPGPTTPYPVQAGPAAPAEPTDDVFARRGRSQDYAAAVPSGYATRSPAWEQEEDDGWDLLPVGDQPWDDQQWEAAQPWDEGRQPWDDEPWDDRHGGTGDDPGSAAAVLPAGTSRRGSRRPAGAGTGVAVVLVMGAFVVGTLVWALDRVQNAQDAAAPGPVVTQTVQPSAEPSVAEAPPPPPSDAPTLVIPAGVQALDPQGDGGENDQEAPRAIDGDPASSWQTQRYNSQDFGRLKTGLGLAFDLGAPADVRSISITAPGTGGTYEVRAASGPTFDGSTVIATGQTGDAPSVLAPETPVTTQFLIVWFTALPQLEGDFRGAVSEVQVQVP